MKVKTFAKAGFSAAVLVMAMATPAAADPVPAGTEFRPIVGVGSDTTQDVMNGLAKVITDGSGNPLVSSWDARPPGAVLTITTKSAAVDPDCTFNRPNGSGAGRTVLKAAKEGGSVAGMVGTDVLGCVQFARSSSAPSTPGTTGNYAYVSFGVDAMTFAKNAGSDLPDSLTVVQLQRIYRCQLSSITGIPVQARLVQPGSGTRAYWNTKMGINDVEIANGDYPCLTILPTVQEHDGAVLNGQMNQIVPMSIAQHISQENSGQTIGGVLVDVADRRGESKLGKVNNINPRTGAGGFTGDVNINFPFIRDVYNVVPVADFPTLGSVFVGPASQVCSRENVIKAFGFGFRPSTGSQPADLLKQGCGDAYLRANS